MKISRATIIEALEKRTPILKHLDELTEDAMKAVFYERIPICEGSDKTRPLVSPAKAKVLAANIGKDNHVIYKGTCHTCGKTVELKIKKTDMVIHSFPFFRGLSDTGSQYWKDNEPYHESNEVADATILFTPNSSHQILVRKEGVNIWCYKCHRKLITEIDEATRDFLGGDVVGWANACNEGNVPQEDLWKKDLFCLWKVHKETHRVVELKIDDRYYWRDEAFTKEVNATCGLNYTRERRFWRNEDNPLFTHKDSTSRFHADGRVVPTGTGYGLSQQRANDGPAMDNNSICWDDDTFGPAPTAPTPRTREYIKKACRPCESSRPTFTKEMMEYVLRAEGVDDAAVMRHNCFLPYEDFLKTPYWFIVSGKVKWAAGHKCAICGGKEDLLVHHLTYEHRGLEGRYPEDLVCLCKKCHEALHEKERITIDRADSRV